MAARDEGAFEAMKLKLYAAALLGLAAAPALAQQSGGMNHGQMDHSQMNHGQMNHGAMMQNTAANPYAQSEMRMHERMMAAQGANADETWIRKMIEHHRGAVEMSQIVVQRGTDAAVKAKARQTIASQQREITELQAMLRRMGVRAQ